MISPFKSVIGGGYKDVRTAAAARHPSALFAAAGTRRGLRKEIKRADQIAAYFEATLLAGFSTAEATEFFGRPRGFNADRFDFTPRSVTSAQDAFLKRYAALEKQRQAAVAVHSASENTLN